MVEVQAKLPEVHNPPQNNTKTEQAAGAMTSLSTHVDPFPHYFMSALTGGGAYYAYRVCIYILYCYYIYKYIYLI